MSVTSGEQLAVSSQPVVGIFISRNTKALTRSPGTSLTNSLQPIHQLILTLFNNKVICKISASPISLVKSNEHSNYKVIVQVLYK